MSRLDKIIARAGGWALVPGSQPFRIDPPEAREAVLLVHGFTGIPKELRAVGEALAASGRAVYAPRLPGHGTGRDDLMAAGAADWLRRAIDAYLELKADYGIVHLLGHSMGALIASIVAADFEAPQLVLLAPAFSLSLEPIRLAPIVGFLRPVIRRGRPPAAGETDPVRIKLHEEYWSDDLVACVGQLLKLRRRALKVLPRLRSRTLLVAGELDETVPVSVVELVRGRAKGLAGLDARILAGAGHLFPFDERAGETAALVAAWFEGLGAPKTGYSGLHKDAFTTFRE